MQEERGMNVPRELCTTGILLAACLGLTTTARADCNGPQALVAAFRALPTIDNATQLADWYGTHKQFACAVDTLRTAEKIDPTSAQLHYLEAVALVSGGQPADAIPALERSISLESNILKPHLLLANLEEASGNSGEADAQWKQALTIDPNSDLALEGFSAALLARKDYSGVVALLDHAPRTEPLALHLAEALESLKYIDQANDVLLAAMKLAPDSPHLAIAESVILIKQRNYDEAVKLLAYAADKHPDDRDAQLQYLRILVLTQHNDRARPLGLKLLAQTPHDPEVLYLNGIADHAVGDDAVSKAHLEEAVAQVPDFFNSQFHLGVVLIALHEWQEAKQHLEKAIALGDEDPKAHFELSMALNGLGDHDQARKEITLYQQMTKAEEDNLEANSHVAQGDQLLKAGNTQEAIANYRQAADQMPNNANYHFKLAVALDAAGDPDGERLQLEQAVKLDPLLAPAQRKLGLLLAHSGDAAGAVQHLQLALKAAPGWVDTWINLSAVLASEAHFPEARDALATALHLDPTNAQALKLSDRLAHDPAAQQAQP